MNLMFAWHEYRKILLLPIESKIHIFSPSRNILCLYSIGMVKGDFRILVLLYLFSSLLQVGLWRGYGG